MLVTIANFTLNIKGAHFLNALTDWEHEHLRPFMDYALLCPGDKRKVFHADVLMFEENKDPRLAPEKRELIVAKIKSHISSCPDQRLKANLLNFMKKGLFSYSPARFAELFLGTDFRRSDYSLSVSKDLVILFKHKSRQFQVYLKRHASPSPLWVSNLQVLKQIYRMVFAVTRSGIVLHASSMEDDHRKGFVFIGPSGSGKSTVISLLKPERILSDDTTVIRKSGGAYHMYANPWWNMDKKVNILSPQKPVVLRALFFIQKAKRVALRRMSYKESLATLLYRDRNLCLNSFPEDTNNILRFYFFSQGLMNKVPAFDLKIKKGPAFKRTFSILSNRI